MQYGHPSLLCKVIDYVIVSLFNSRASWPLAWMVKFMWYTNSSMAMIHWKRHLQETPLFAEGGPKLIN